LYLEAFLEKGILMSFIIGGWGGMGLLVLVDFIYKKRLEL